MTSGQSRPHVLISGGTGYVGARLACAALHRGCAVTILARDPARVPHGARFLRWSLGDALPPDAVGPDQGDAVLFHLAHDWTNGPSPDTQGMTLNETATARLLASARLAGVSRFIFMSSQSAQPDAATDYGLVKWRIEQTLNGPDTASARVGPIYGGRAGSLYGQLLRLIALPALPMISPRQLVQPIHIDEVCGGLLTLALGPMTGPWKMAAPQPIMFGDMLRTLAREALGRRLIIIPVPLWMALLGCRITALIPFIPTVSEQRVRGLASVRVMPCTADLAALGLEVRPIAYHIRRGPRGRKALLVEAMTLLRYILGRHPGTGLLRTYVRAARRLDPEAGPVGLSPLMIAWPASIAVSERLRRTGLLERRLDLATTLADASPDGARAFLARDRAWPMARLLGRLVLEAAIMPVRLVLTLARRRD